MKFITAFIAIHNMDPFLAFITVAAGLALVVILSLRSRARRCQASRQKTILDQLKREKGALLGEKNALLREKDAEIEDLKSEKAQLESKYIAKLKESEARKKNLEKWRKKQGDTRKGLREELEEVVANHDKWLPHAREEPRSGKLGKPPGAPGGGKCRPEVIHKRVHVFPPACDACGADLSNVEAHFHHAHAFADLEDLQWGDLEYKALTLLNTELAIYRRKCPHCKKWVYPDSGPLKHLRYGLNFVTFVIGKRMRTRMPFELIVGDLIEQFGERLTLSAPTIVGWFKRHEPILRDLYAQLQKIVRLLAHVHADETGLPMNGKNWWTWVICNEHFVWYLQRQSRGHQAIEDILDGFEGVLNVDCWGAYNKLDVEQQKCLAHLVTDLNEILVRLRKESERAEKLLVEHENNETLASDPAAPGAGPQEETGEPPGDHAGAEAPAGDHPSRRAGRPKKKVKLTAGDAERLEARLENNARTIGQAARLKDFLKESWKDGPRGWRTPPGERVAKDDAVQEFLHLIGAIWKENVVDEDLARLLKRCEKHAGAFFAYLDHEGVEPDNNEAERALRSMVVQRKTSGGFKSPIVGEVYHLLKSLLETCQRNGKNFEDLHGRLLAGEAVNLAEYFFK